MKSTNFILMAGILFFALACQETKPDAKSIPISAEDKALYMQKGKMIAKNTFENLSGQLQKAMGEGGVANAIQYCNLAAMPLVDSLSKAHQAEIRRTSLKVRNPKDAPTQLEKEILEQYAAQHAKGEELRARVRQLGKGGVAFFAPIKVNALCLQCHGKPGETLTLENYEIIKKYYPEDKAINYLVGDLRGMWSIHFHKKQ